VGRVYLAQHHRIDRRAAIKVLLPELSANAAVVERFFAEARATSTIHHPGIVEVLDCDMKDDTAFIVMEYLEGESLASYIRRVPAVISDRAFALSVVVQIAQAVAAAHARGIIHRDIKPDNVFLCTSPDEPQVVTKVLDFGIAKLAQQHNSVHTRSGAIMGTPAYMSPEQCRGGNRVIDSRSDVYSLGCILYELLCGRRPFSREGLGDMILAHVAEKADPPLNLVPDLLPALDTLTLRMLAKDPEGRPQSMDDVAERLLDCLKQLGVDTPVADIRPAVPVALQVRTRGTGTRTGVSVAPDGGPGAIPQAQTQINSGGTRLLVTGQGLTEFEDAQGLAPIPTTFQETAGESMRRALLSPRFRSAAVLAVVAIAGGSVGAALMSRGAGRTPEPAVELSPASSATIPTEMRGAPLAARREFPTVTVDVRGLPAGAEVWLDGAPAAGLPLRLIQNDQRHVLSLRAPGFQERVLAIDAHRDAVVDGALTPAAAPAQSPATAQAGKAEGARARQGSGARDRVTSPVRRRAAKRGQGQAPGEAKPDGKSDAAPEENRELRAITDI